MAKRPTDPTLDVLSEIKSDLKSINSELKDISVTLAEQKGILDLHIHRTELAEAAIAATAASATESRNELSKRIIPLEAHMSMWSGIGKFLAVIAGALAAAGAIVAVWQFIVGL